MSYQKSNTKPGLLLLPLTGILVFTFLYIIATLLYPGGSQADAASIGFSWLDNYWCNLLNEQAMNGKVNTARPVAFCAMCILCSSLAGFWYQFAGAIQFKSSIRKSIRVSGILSMITGLFLFSKNHDSIINVSGMLAVFAVAGTFAGLYKSKWHGLFWFGLLNMGLVGANNFLYYNHQLRYLPVIQKITFLSFLLWVSLIIIKLYFSSRREAILLGDKNKKIGS